MYLLCLAGKNETQTKARKQILSAELDVTEDVIREAMREGEAQGYVKVPDDYDITKSRRLAMSKLDDKLKPDSSLAIDNWVSIENLAKNDEPDHETLLSVASSVGLPTLPLATRVHIKADENEIALADMQKKLQNLASKNEAGSKATMMAMMQAMLAKQEEVDKAEKDKKAVEEQKVQQQKAQQEAVEQAAKDAEEQKAKDLEAQKVIDEKNERKRKAADAAEEKRKLNAPTAVEASYVEVRELGETLDEKVNYGYAIIKSIEIADSLWAWANALPQKTKLADALERASRVRDTWNAQVRTSTWNLLFKKCGNPDTYNTLLGDLMIEIADALQPLTAVVKELDAMHIALIGVHEAMSIPKSSQAPARRKPKKALEGEPVGTSTSMQDYVAVKLELSKPA